MTPAGFPVSPIPVRMVATAYSSWVATSVPVRPASLGTPAKTVTMSEFLHAVAYLLTHLLPVTRQWGAEDAEVKVPSGENTELECSPFKAWSRPVYSHTC